MGGGSLSTRVSNMKFMQSAGDRKRKEAKTAAEQQESKHLKDISEWSLPVNGKTMKVIKSKSKKVRKLGYSSISSLGPVSDLTNSDTTIIGRKTVTVAETPSEIPTKELKKDESSPEHEQTKEKKKSKKLKKPKKKVSAIDAFKTTSDDDFDPNEVDLTSKNLLDLWKSKKN